MQQVASSIEDYAKFLSRSSISTTYHSSKLLWSCLSATQVQLNTDGCFTLHSQQFGYDGLTCNAFAIWLGGYSGFSIGLCDLSAELVTFKHDLLLAQKFGHRHCVCESDSFGAIRMLESIVFAFGDYTGGDH